jgi:hypothetical protein
MPIRTELLLSFFGTLLDAGVRVHVTAVRASPVRQLRLAALRARNHVHRAERQMGTPRAFPHFALLANR